MAYRPSDSMTVSWLETYYRQTLEEGVDLPNDETWLGSVFMHHVNKVSKVAKESLSSNLQSGTIVEYSTAALISSLFYWTSREPDDEISPIENLVRAGVQCACILTPYVAASLIMRIRRVQHYDLSLRYYAAIVRGLNLACSLQTIYQLVGIPSGTTDWTSIGTAVLLPFVGKGEPIISLHCEERIFQRVERFENSETHRLADHFKASTVVQLREKLVSNPRKQELRQRYSTNSHTPSTYIGICFYLLIDILKRAEGCSDQELELSLASFFQMLEPPDNSLDFDSIRKLVLERQNIVNLSKEELLELLDDLLEAEQLELAERSAQHKMILKCLNPLISFAYINRQFIFEGTGLGAILYNSLVNLEAMRA